MKTLKTTLSFIAILFAISASAQTQRFMEIYKGGAIAQKIKVTDIDSLKFADYPEVPQVGTITSADLDSEGYYTIEEPVVGTHTYNINTALVEFSHLWSTPIKGMKFHIPQAVSKISFSANPAVSLPYIYILNKSNPGGSEWSAAIYNGDLNSNSFESGDLSSHAETWFWIVAGNPDVVGEDIELTIVLE